MGKGRQLSSFTAGGAHFEVRAITATTKRNGHHVRVQHRLNGKPVTQREWLDAHKRADPEAHERAYGNTDDDAGRCSKDCPAAPDGACPVCDDAAQAEAEEDRERDRRRDHRL